MVNSGNSQILAGNLSEKITFVLPGHGLELVDQIGTNLDW
jgi:hypothetical protein